MRWLIEDFKFALRELKRSDVWLFLGILAGFALLALVVATFAFQTDSILRFLHMTKFYCREMTNGPIIFLFCGMIFFMLAATVTFGNLQRYFFCRDRGITHEARTALGHSLASGGVAALIAIGAILFFKSNCM